MITIAKVLITLFVLVKASWHDLKTREIPDSLWLIMIFTSIPLDVLQYVIDGFDLVFAVIQFVVIFVLANVMFYLLGFGGADCKALICLALMFPTYPKLFEFTTPGFIFALSVLTNSVIVAPALPLILAIRNAIKGDIGKLMFIGYKVDIDDIPKFHNLLEYVKNGKVVKSAKGVELNDEMIIELKKLGVRRVWVTPALPFIVFMTFGFVLAVTVGDVLITILKQI
jgi:preflagellin peptidase FlaK